MMLPVEGKAQARALVLLAATAVALAACSDAPPAQPTFAPGIWESHDGTAWIVLGADGVVDELTLPLDLPDDGCGGERRATVSTSGTYEVENYPTRVFFRAAAIPNYVQKLETSREGDWAVLVYLPCGPDEGDRVLLYRVDP